MKIWGFLAALVTAIGIFTAASAQDRAWIQVEAQPTAREAVERAEAWAAAFPDVTAYQTGTGWFAIVLGPYAPEAAAGQLASLRRENLIPGDSFIADGARFGEVLWPVGGRAAKPAPLTGAPILPVEPVIELPAPPAEAVAEPAPEPVAPPDETEAEARASEATLLPEERRELQEALSWYGFYQGGIDGAFGRGTRASMAAWQEANGFDATGTLTTRQRATLVGNHRADQAEFGFCPVTETEAGIEITLPLSLVEFEGYEPPFVTFREKAGSGLRIVLLSEPGGTEALHGLYDILQTLESVPATGERSKTDDSFTIDARSATVQSHAWAQTDRGMVKGYLAIWRPEDAARMERILPVLQSSFRAIGDRALDPGLVPMEDAARQGLLAGLEVRRPVLTRSGFFVDAGGAVVTVAEAVAQCGRITIEHEAEADVVATDAASGLAVLRPRAPLAPPAVAALAAALPRPGSPVTVAGYSYGDRLPAPALTLGAFEEGRGLNGEAGLARLTAQVLPGDAGGPVLDATGAVAGVLIPGGAPQGKALPEGVAFAATADVLAPLLAQAGVTATMATAPTPASPDALKAAGLGMTVIVSCWE